MDRASASSVYPGIDIEGVRAMTLEWSLTDVVSNTKIGNAFDLSNMTGMELQK